jgi:hypothetical protein
MRRASRCRVTASATAAALACLPAPGCDLLSGAGGDAFVRRFADLAPVVHCDPVPALPTDGRPVRDVAPAGDTAFLVLFSDDGEAVVYDADYRRLRAVPIPRAGPGMVTLPGSAALAGDTLLVADRATGRIQRFDLDGEPGTALSLGFRPAVIRSEGGRTWIAPLVVGGQPGRLLYELVGGRALPLDIRPAERTDFTLGALANAVVIAAFADGRAVLAHQFLEHRAFRIDGGRRPRAAPLPLPEGAQWGERAPTPPITPEVLGGIFTAALAASADPRSGDLLYVVRSGRRGADHHEKALVRADRRLRFRSAVRLSINATRVVALPGRDRLLVTDAENLWYECPAPAAGPAVPH